MGLYMLITVLAFTTFSYIANAEAKASWQQKHKKLKGSIEFVEYQPGRHLPGLIESPRPILPGEGFLARVMIYPDPTDVKLYFFNEKDQEISGPVKSFETSEFGHYFFSGKFPDVPFYAKFLIKLPKNKSHKWYLNPELFKPRTDLISYKFKAKLSQTQSARELLYQEIFKPLGVLSSGPTVFCPIGRRLQQFFKSSGKQQTFSFYTRYSLGHEAEEKNQCYLEVLQKPNSDKIIEYTATDRYWNRAQCEEYRSGITTYGPKARVEKSLAFLGSSCEGTQEGTKLRLRIAFSNNPDFKFPNVPKISRLKPLSIQKTFSNKIQLEEICSIYEGVLANLRTPIDLSYEKSGKALIFLRDGKFASFQIPDCKVIARYSKANFHYQPISRDGTGIFSENDIFDSKSKKGIRTFGLEKENGKLILLNPPEKFDRSNLDFPKISADGSSVIWEQKIKIKNGNRTHDEWNYFIQDLDGNKVKETPYSRSKMNLTMFDMERKSFWAYQRSQGLVLFNLDGKIIEGPLKIAGVDPDSRSKIIFFPGKKMNWVAWNAAVLRDSTPFVTWETDHGSGSYNFNEKGRIHSLSVSGNGRYIAVAHANRPGFMTGTMDFLFSLISTATGEIIYVKKIAVGSDSGNPRHDVSFLGNDYIAYNNLVKKGNGLSVDSVALFKIKKFQPPF